MIWNRGSPQDYNNWARLTKDNSWSYENMLKYFKRSESYSGFNPTNQRGFSGPISVINPNYTFAADKLLEAGQEIGYPIGDPNGPQTPSVAKLDFSHKLGRRASAFSGYIKPVLKKLEKLTILLNTEAKRILFEGKRAVGVTFKKNSYAMARKEIILTAGALDSALILQRSGVGPKEVLQKSRIPIVAELPVGENLHTHPAIQFPIIYGNRSALFIQSRDLTPEAWRLYQETGTGPYSYYIGASAQGFFLSRKAQSNWPDIQIIPFGMETGSLEDVPDLQVWEASSQWRIEGLRPKSRGVIKLNPKDSNEAPFLDFRLLTHPDDVQLIVEGIKLVQRLCEGTNAFQSVGCRFSKVPYPPCKHFNFQSDSYWACFVRQFGVASSHAVGTCRMGIPEDPEAVVDSQLNVLGVQGLRVADASVMPQVTNANTQAAVYGIAEKAAGLILSKWEPQHN